MAQFLFSYRTPADYAPARPDSLSAWAAWFQGMGDQLVDAGQPVRESRQIGDCGAGQRLAGYTVVTADTVEEALTLAQGCPGLQRGFGVEVGALADPSATTAPTTTTD
jgi:hypothetical protein